MSASEAKLAQLMRINSDPAVIAKRVAARTYDESRLLAQRLNADPDILAKRGCLLPDQKLEVERRILAREPYKVIAADFRISLAWVCKLARRMGHSRLQRRKR